MSVALAIDRWRAGERHVERLEGRVGLRAVAVVDALVAELRRRLGGPFAVGELVDLYEGGVPWALDLAVRHAPDDPDAWDARVSDAAFAIYVRRARDWSGGRVAEPE